MKLLEILVSILCTSLAVYFSGRLMDRRLRKRDELAFIKFPVLKELQSGQVVTVELKNGQTISHAAFFFLLNLKIRLATDRRIDKETGEMAYHKIIKVKVKDIKSIQKAE